MIKKLNQIAIWKVISNQNQIESKSLFLDYSIFFFPIIIAITLTQLALVNHSTTAEQEHS
jgi:TfoX/Sxy family transcriptional regulator of competence genes